MALSFCPNCGAQRLPDARYCGSCGYDLGAAGGAAAPRADTPSPLAAARTLRWGARAAVAVVVVLVATGGVYALRR